MPSSYSASSSVAIFESGRDPVGTRAGALRAPAPLGVLLLGDPLELLFLRLRLDVRFGPLANEATSAGDASSARTRTQRAATILMGSERVCS